MEKKVAQSQSHSQHRGQRTLVDLFHKPVSLNDEQAKVFQKALDDGKEKFENINTARLDNILDEATENMQGALYDLLYLLHVNDPSMTEYSYTATYYETEGDRRIERRYQETENLYVEGAPHGVLGLQNMHAGFMKKFREHIFEKFGVKTIQTPTECNICSVQIVGSAGSVAYKSGSSDYDIEIIYELQQFLQDTQGLTDAELEEYLIAERDNTAAKLIDAYKSKHEKQSDAPPDQQADEKELSISIKISDQQRRNFVANANQLIKKRYPGLYQFMGHVLTGKDKPHDLPGLARNQIISEVIKLIKSKNSINSMHADAVEKLLKRIRIIEQYLAKRYPDAEVHLFVVDGEDYRRGQHGTTLASKESSGSAYQMILNYELLMTAVQINPVFPAHFILPDAVVQDKNSYQKILDYIRFGLLDIYSSIRNIIYDAGGVYQLTEQYVGTHFGAAYWEAFKASSGNLPKALLNLMRYEMLLNKDINHTKIQLLKKPELLNKFIDLDHDHTNEHEADNKELPVSLSLIHELEAVHHSLMFDPWWITYKAIKIFVNEPSLTPELKDQQRINSSYFVDIAFCMHVRISDVFPSSGVSHKPKTVREKILLDFFNEGFINGSTRRQHFIRLFAGEIGTINQVEANLKLLFQETLQRIDEKIEAANIDLTATNKEFELWFHYYKENFRPQGNVIGRSMMNHLRMPRQIIRIAYIPNDGWSFSSIQRESTIGRRFDSFNMLNYLPEEVLLRKSSSFLSGLGDLVVNGYYGVLNKGSLRARKSIIEYDLRNINLGNNIDNSLAFVKIDTLNRLIDSVVRNFAHQEYDYKTCINEDRRITDIGIFLNMFRYGRLSILYRDNLRTWYSDEFDHESIFAAATKYSRNLKMLIGSKHLHITLAKFFQAKNVDIGQVNLFAWINPSSIETSHSIQQLYRKEEDINLTFLSAIRQVHSKHRKLNQEKEREDSAPKPDNPQPEAQLNDNQSLN